MVYISILLKYTIRVLQKTLQYNFLNVWSFLNLKSKCNARQKKSQTTIYVMIFLILAHPKMFLLTYESANKRTLFCQEVHLQF